MRLKTLFWISALLVLTGGGAVSAKEGFLEYDAHGGHVSFQLADCAFIETRRYDDWEQAERSNYVDRKIGDLNRMSLWVVRPENGISPVLKVTDSCESWRYSDQCISIDEALSVVERQRVRLGCDEMYVSCVRVDHQNGDFALQDNIEVLWWSTELGSENIPSQQRILRALYRAIDDCKTRNHVSAPILREDSEGAILKALDLVRERTQDTHAEFRDVFSKGPPFMPAVCGEVKHRGNDAFVRFTVFGPIGIKLGTAPDDMKFDSKVWGRYCQ